jgi:hypothetical protein
MFHEKIGGRLLAEIGGKILLAHQSKRAEWEGKGKACEQRKEKRKPDTGDRKTLSDF